MPSGLLDEDRTSKAACLARGLRLERLAKSVQVIWNRRLRTTAGRAWYSVDVIELNPRILAFGDPEVDRTLLHELAHLVAHERAGSRKISPHGVEWKQACAELGIPGEAAKHQLPMPRTQQARRFLYRCPSCGVEIRKARRFRSPAACLACCRKYAGGQFDKRFVLNGPETS